MAGSKDVLPGGGGGDSDPLLPRAEGFFEYNRRPRRDTAWLVAYGVVFLAALAGGIFAFVNRNDNYGVLLKPESLSDPKLCPAPTTGGRRRLLVRAEGDDASWQADMFLGTALVLLGVSAAGAILLGVVLLLLARHHPKFVVYSALMLQVTLPGVGGLAALFGGNIPGGVVLLVLAAILALCFWVWWDRIQLVVSLLGVAGRALSDNMGLLPLALGLQLLLGLLEVPLLLAALAALMNGKLAYNDARVDGGTAKRAGECVDADGEVVPCCAWQTEPWVGAYMSLAAIAMLWTLFLIGEAKVFVVAGAVGQWYFQPVSQLNTRSETNKRGPSRVALSARHAAGPSLGSLAAGSAVLTLVSVIRSAARRAQRERNGGNALAALAAACLAALLALVEFLTRFATVRAALSGESFFAAGRNVTSLLKRNALDAFGVWWLPPMILQTFCAMLAVAWAIVVAAVGGSVWSGMPQGSGAATLIAVIAFLTAWAVLAFCAGLLLNVVDAVFVCFAMERDAHTCVHPEVHEVYSRLPTVGPIVENPGGEVVYGQPAAVASAPPPAQYPYVPPATRV